jgi:uncharacterized cupredoxin-like copper-binding protein
MRRPVTLTGTSQQWRVLIACVATLVLLCGCGAGTSPGASSGGGTLVGVTERDFHISTTIARVPAGEVTLRIDNQGPDQHELIVAPERAGGLPMRSDGFTVNEEAIQNSEPGSITPQAPAHTEYLRLHLAAGRYVLFCNMEGHYMGGMHTTLVVG